VVFKENHLLTGGFQGKPPADRWFPRSRFSNDGEWTPNRHRTDTEKRSTFIVFKPSPRKVHSDHQILNSQPQGPDPENHLLTGGFQGKPPAGRWLSRKTTGWQVVFKENHLLTGGFQGKPPADRWFSRKTTGWQVV